MREVPLPLLPQPPRQPLVVYTRSIYSALSLVFFSRRRDCCGFLLPPNKPRPLSHTHTHTHSRREQEPKRGGNSTTLQLLRLCVVVVVQYSFCCALLFYYSSKPLPGNSVALEGEEEEAVLHNWVPLVQSSRDHMFFSHQTTFSSMAKIKKYKKYKKDISYLEASFSYWETAKKGLLDLRISCFLFLICRYCAIHCRRR